MQRKIVKEIEAQSMNLEGAKGVTMRPIFSEESGPPNFAMRFFEVQPGGHTPFHHHPYEHEVYLLEGEGEIKGRQECTSLRAGEAAYVPPNEEHQFINVGEKILKFLCLIPLSPNNPRSFKSFEKGGGVG